MTDLPDAPPPPPEAKAKSFYALAPGALAYPFRHLGWALVLVGAVVYAALSLFTGAGIFGLMLKVLVTGYVAAFMIKVIAAAGCDVNWPASSPLLPRRRDATIIPWQPGIPPF